MPSLLELNLFTLLLFFAVALMVWFLVARELASTRRMKCMMAEMGLEYDLATSAPPAVEGAMNKARARCLRCRNEGLCERWLEATARGEALAGKYGTVMAEDFCPNAGTFKILSREGALQREPEEAAG